MLNSTAESSFALEVHHVSHLQKHARQKRQRTSIYKAAYQNSKYRTKRKYADSVRKLKQTRNYYDPMPFIWQQEKKRIVIIDGSNVACSHAESNNDIGGFSVRGIQYCLELLKTMDCKAVVVIPQMRLQRSMSSDPDLLNHLRLTNKIIFTPCKNLPGNRSTSYDDRIILQLAEKLNGAIISNDNYRDLLDESPNWRAIIENRVIGFTWCFDAIMLPQDPYGRNGPTLKDILDKRSI